MRQTLPLIRKLHNEKPAAPAGTTLFKVELCAFWYALCIQRKICVWVRSYIQRYKFILITRVCSCVEGKHYCPHMQPVELFSRKTEKRVLQNWSVCVCWQVGKAAGPPAGHPHGLSTPSFSAGIHHHIPGCWAFISHKSRLAFQQQLSNVFILLHTCKLLTLWQTHNRTHICTKQLK